jgi:dTDP-4-amino-4,6-dideoxygalactose transaminase
MKNALAMIPNAPDAHETIELMRPLLPKAEAILPYLRQIDQNRWYSNFGPLEREFRSRTAKYFSLPEEAVLPCSNATSGLTSVLNAMNRPKQSFCLMPSWTFVATPAAAIAAEMTPYFLDVDDATWALDPAHVKSVLKTFKGVVGAIVVVAPYGRAIDLKAWDKLAADTSIPVVIDAAAGFDAFRNASFGHVPVVFSLHATKVFGVGEGGVIVSRDAGLMRHVQEQTNFGFYTRHISTPGQNSKMSEYVAAVGLAAHDGWAERRREWSELIGLYIDVFEPLAKKHNFVLWMDRDDVTSTCSLRLSEPKADAVISQLNGHGIKARQWWDKGCHRQPAYASYPHEELKVTQAIGDSIVALPFYLDIPRHQIGVMAECLDAILSA